MTIINNCGNCLYLGDQDWDTAKYISLRSTGLWTLFSSSFWVKHIFTPGALSHGGCKKFDIRSHELPDSAREAPVNDADPVQTL